MNTAILRYPLPVLGKTDKRVLVLTLLKAPKKRAGKTTANGNWKGRTNPPSHGKNLPAGVHCICVWGHYSKKNLCMGACMRSCTAAVFGWPAGAWPESAWVVPDQARERRRLLRINAVGDAEFLEPGGRRSRAPSGQASRQAFLEENAAPCRADRVNAQRRPTS